MAPSSHSLALLRRSLSSSSSAATATASTAKHGPPSAVIVQKFGGTSLGTSEKLDKSTAIIRQFHQPEKGQGVVAVVSALSSETKAEGTTSRLLAAADAAVNQAGWFFVENCIFLWWPRPTNISHHIARPDNNVESFTEFGHFLDRIEDTHMVRFHSTPLIEKRRSRN